MKDKLKPISRRKQLLEKFIHLPSEQRHKQCQFITLGWFKFGAGRAMHYCRLFKIPLPGVRDKMTRDDMDLINVKAYCELKSAQPKPPPRQPQKPTPVASGGGRKS